MKFVYIAALVLLWSMTASGQWIKQQVNTTASLRGLSVVNEKVVWASGTGGTFLRTIDGGKTWKVGTIPGAKKLDFRDIEAFDANTAYILSIGNGESSRIYKTIDGGETWKLQFKNTNEKAFFDAIACWDKKNCIAMSDPVDGHYLLIATSDGGNIWKPIVTNNIPAAKDGEAAFAASGTCLITQGKTNAFIVSGGSAARVFRSPDRGVSWSVADTPIVKGTPGSGIFSIAMRNDKNGVIVGGNYEKPEQTTNNLAFTADGGRTWMLGSGLNGYRSGVAFLDRKSLIAVGSNGSEIRWRWTKDKSWTPVGQENLNSVQSDGKHMIWAVGPNGLVVRQYFGEITLD
jgi:photosystem II stability/assembly factor-like uncharacterized protein